MRRRAASTAVALLLVAACNRDVDLTKPIARPPATAANAVGIDPVTGASIATSKDDYNPGEMVHVTGRGWSPGESVHLVMTEEPDAHPDVAMDVTADTSGTFSVHFYDVQEYDRGVTFTLTASGDASHSSATAVFTDTRILTLFEIQNVAAPGPVTVGLGSSFTIRATGTTDVAPPGFGAGIDDWESTFWQIRGPAPSTSIIRTGCSNTINVTSPTVGARHVFSVPAPAVVGTYTVEIRAFQIDDCFANPSNVLTYAGGLIVSVALPNVAPSVDAGPDATINEGAAFTASGSFADPDANSWTGAVDYGDGSGVQALALSARGFALSHVYADNGNFTVTVSVNDGTATGTDQVAVRVDNVAPTATFTAPAAVHVGNPFALALTSAADPSSADVAAGFQYAFDCGDGAGFGAFASANTRSCRTSASGSRGAKGKIRDKDGGQSEYGASVDVTNASPVAMAGGPYTGNEGAVIAIAGSASDADGTVASTMWSVSPAAACSIADASAVSTTVSCSDNGSFTLTLQATDNDGASSRVNVSLAVANVAPTATFTAPAGVHVGTPFALALTSPADPSYADVAAGLQYAFDCGDGAGFGAFGSANSRSCPTSALGSRSAKGRVRDKDGGQSDYSASVSVTNAVPVVSSGGPYTGNEGAVIAIGGSAGDPDGTIATTTWSVSPAAACSIANASDLSTTVSCPDNGSFTLTLSATDNDGASSTKSVSLAVANVAPVIGAVGSWPVSGDNVYAVSQSVTLKATYADAGVPDTHTCWATTGAGAFSVSGSGGQGSGTNPNRSCSSSMSFAQAGVYDVGMTVSDDDGGSATKWVQVVVSDPSAGFVTSGGWIDSPAGAFAANTALTGKATFGIDAKYKKNSWLPEGNTQFNFHAGSFAFQSDGYTYLVINPAGTTARFKGIGTVNGAGRYCFMVWMTDGTVDTFRMKVWNATTGDVVYDTQPQASDTATPTAPVNGSIVIHTKN